MGNKRSLATAAVIAVYVLIIGCTVFMILTGRTLYLPGIFLSEYAFGFAVFAVLILAHIIIKCVGFFGKSKEDPEERGVFDIVIIAVSCVILVFAVLGFIRQTGNSENERIDLPDGNRVVLNEKKSSGNETVYVDVYKVNGIIARLVGGIYDEEVLTDNFIEESSWDYTYDEEEKLLTIYWYSGEEDSIFFEEDEENDEEEFDVEMWEAYISLE